MKNYSLLFILAASLLMPSQITQAETDDGTRRPTWIERIFSIGNDKEAKKEAEEVKKVAKKEAQKEIVDDKEKQVKQSRGFSEEEREVLESWRLGNASWKKSKKPLPPGLQKKVGRGGELPPGWKKKLEVGAVLEPKVDAQAKSLPEEILSRLPESETGIEILRVGDEIIRVIEGTREIADILGGTTKTESAED